MGDSSPTATVTAADLQRLAAICPSCKGPYVKAKLRVGPVSVSAKYPLAGGSPTGSVEIGTPGSIAGSAQLCGSIGDSSGLTSTVGGSWNGVGVTNSQSFMDPLSDSSNSTQFCVPLGQTNGFSSSAVPNVSVGVGNIPLTVTPGPWVDENPIVSSDGGPVPPQIERAMDDMQTNGF